MAIKGSGLEIEDFFGNLVDSLNTEFGHSDCAKDIVEFLEKEVDFDSWGVNELHRRQLLLLKTFYGLELDEEDEQILDSWFQLDRTSVDPKNYVPGTKYQSLCVECGRRGSKCITLDTIIFTNYGLLEARELIFDRGKQIVPFRATVAVPGRGRARSGYRYLNGVVPVRRIKSSCGYELGGTPNHKVRVLGTDGCIKWEELGEIKPGELVAIERNADLWSKDLAEIDRVRGEFLLEEQAYALGLIHAYFLPLVSPFLGKGGRECTKRGGAALLGKWLLMAKSSKVSDQELSLITWLFFGWLFYNHVPTVIKKSPRSVVLSFIYGFCKINAHRSEEGIKVVVSSEQLARELQIVFINLGIVSQRKKVSKSESWLEVKEQRSIEIYITEIEREALRAEEEKEVEDSTDIIYHQQDWLLRLLAACSPKLISQYYDLVGDSLLSPNFDGKITKNQLSTLLTWIKQNSVQINQPDLWVNHFEELLVTDYFFDEVVDISHSVEDTLDISVPGYECYTANGFTSHNTFVSSIVIAYEFYRLAMMKSPQKYYGVATSSSIAIYCIATTATQTKRTMFGQAKALLEHIPKLKRLIDQKKIILGAEEISYPDKLIFIYSGNSSSASQVGSSVILLAMDEVARFDEEGKEAEDSNALTLWSNIGISGVTFGEDAKRIAISSAWAEGDAIQRLYQLSKTSNGWMGYRLRSWDLNPKHAARDNPIIKAEYDLDPRKAALEFEGVRFNKIYSFFDDLEVNRAFTGYSQIKVTPDECTDDQLVRLKVISIKSFTGKTYAHLDPAFVTDAYAIAFGHTEGDGEERKVIIDGLLAWQPSIGEQVSISNVYQVIYQLHNQRPLSKVTSDHYNPETIQRLKLNGLNASTINFSRSKQLEIYDLFRKLLHEDRVQLPKDSPWSSLLKDELLGIQLKKSTKIDHRKDGSKDLADAVTAVTWNLMSSTTVNATYTVAVERNKRANLPKDIEADLGFSHNARSVISQVKQNYSGWSTDDYSTGAWTIEP